MLSKQLYNFLLIFAQALLTLMNATRATHLLSPHSKLRKFVEGRSGDQEIRRSGNNDRSLSEGRAEQRLSYAERHEGLERSDTTTQSPLYWLHCASLGEYAIMRPIIQRLRADGAHIHLTFFSPTGVEAIPGATYLPLDTPRNARRYVDALTADGRLVAALFAVSELWPNHLAALRQHAIPTYLISAKITPRTAALRWYGGPLLDALRPFTKILVLDATSQTLLRDRGIHSAVLTGDPLFDNALAIAAEPYHDATLDTFCRDHRVLIAGSIHDARDLAMIAHLVRRHPTERFILVPHEVSPSAIAKVRDAIKNAPNALIITTMGQLARLYRYGTCAYVGGGFTPLLHSVVEPLVYGIPVAFGPMIHRKTTPQEMIARGIGTIVHDAQQLEEWWQQQLTRDLNPIATAAHTYTQENSGATDRVMQEITSRLSSSSRPPSSR